MPDSLSTVLQRTTCPYCGVGCGVEVLSADGGETISVRGDAAHPANQGRLCSKGSALAESLSLPHRLTQPLWEGAPVSWDLALDEISARLQDVLATHGPEAVAFYGSGQLLTEDYYVLNKLAKGFIGTGNVDTNSRLCMASTVAGHKQSFGTDTVPGLYADWELADLVILVGSNTAWCHPVLFQRLLAARKSRGLKIVVLDPRQTSTTAEADVHLPLRGGSDIALFSGLLRAIAEAGAVNAAYVADHTRGFDEALATAPDLATVAAATGLSPVQIAAFYKLFIDTAKVVTVFSQGINQSSHGSNSVSAILNVHLATGRIGMPGCGPFSITGQPNAMGGREVGGLANQLAAHMDFASETDRDRVQRFWRAPNLAQKPGLKAVDMMQGAADGKIKFLWILATNPLASLPDADVVQAALERCPTVILSDCVADTETARYAHFLLPAATWGEKDGTVTNSERRVSRQRAFRAYQGAAKPDWWALAQVGQRLGYEEAFAYENPAAIFREHAALSDFENGGRRDFDLGGAVSLSDDAYDALPPFCWPWRAGESPSLETRFFANGGFFTPDGRARFVPTGPTAPLSQTSPAFPLVLNTGRVRDQWHTMGRTGSTPRLMNHQPRPTVSINPQDAAALGLVAGDLVRLASATGATIRLAEITDAQPRGEVFASMHWNGAWCSGGAVGRVIAPNVDPLSGQPELKFTPVSLTRMEPRWQGYALLRDAPEILGQDALPGLFWCKRPLGDAWAVELWALPESEVVPEGAALLAALMGEAATQCTPLTVADPARGRWRGAYLHAGKLVAALMLGPGPTLEHLLPFFAEADLTDAQAVLAGRVAAPSAGPMVCACFQVSAERIRAVIASGEATSVEAIGTLLKAGTNCGSCLPELKGFLRHADAPLVA
ncbi:MAG: molybdopterin-dependent oxidoreductase [Elstera sp.]